MIDGQGAEIAQRCLRCSELATGKDQEGWKCTFHFGVLTVLFG